MPIRAAPIHTPHAAVDPSPILFLIGVILIFFGLAMLLPAAVDLHDGNDDYLVFVACSAISVFLGAVMTATGHGRRAKMNAREVILGVPLTWICMAVFGALPFMFLAQLILALGCPRTLSAALGMRPFRWSSSYPCATSPVQERNNHNHELPDASHPAPRGRPPNDVS